MRVQRNGEYRNINWKIRQTGELSERDVNRYGDILITLLDGNKGIYTERHWLDETSLETLETRLKHCIGSIHDDENIEMCGACNQLYNRNVGSRIYEQELTWADRHIFKNGLDPRYKAVETYEHAETCVYTTGRIFDTIHTITHLWDVNPFYTDAELADTDSLVMTRGFSRTRPDGETRPFEALQEKYKELKRVNPDGRDNRDKRNDLLELLDWALKREDRFYTDRRFKYRHRR